MKPYPEYKDSRIKWLGEIPMNWELTRMDGFADHVKKVIDPDDIRNETVIHYSIPYVQEFDTGQQEEGRTVNSTKLLLSGGEVLVSKLNPRKETITIVKQNEKIRIVASSEFVPLQTKSVDSSKFLFYLFKSSNVKDFLCSTVESATKSHQRTNPAYIYKLWFALPPPPEQKQIAKYLDHKTAKIDPLIEKKKRLIELLNEERTAVINQAVTKGFDPNVPMKDSGIEWLGEIPAHWEVVKLKYLSKIKYGLGQPPKQLENGLPIIRATNISRGKIMPKDLMFIDPDDVPYDRDPVLRTDDIIVVRSGAYTADSAIIPKEFDGSITGYDMVVRVIKTIPNYIAFTLLSNYVLDNQLIPLSLRAAQPHLNAEELGSTNILTPPETAEQISIVKYLDKETTRIDNIISKSEKEIELLQEYRTALISEVVTGKIDVREGKI